MKLLATSRWITARVLALFVIAGCSMTQPPAASPGAPTQQTAPVVYVTQPVQQAPATPKKNQPAAMKLKLGHYTDGTIGVVIDRTEETENVADIDPIKVRFDGETKIWKLKGEAGALGRIDYVRDDGHVMVHMFENDRFSIYVPNTNGEQSSGEIQLYRDADADPL
jgi:hypothetical protein